MLSDSSGASAIAPEDILTSRNLAAFIDASPTPFHAVVELCRRLDEAGFTRLEEAEAWDLAKGRGYYVTRDGSSLIAFRIPSDAASLAFRIVATHVDSPALRIKPVADLPGPGTYLRLNVEGYGSRIERSWLDRPLALAGRIFAERDGRIEGRLVVLDDVVNIPSVAIHLNRKVNEEGALNVRADLCPLMSAGRVGQGGLDGLLARELDLAPQALLAYDLIVCNRQHGLVWGAENEFVSAPRLDNLQGTYAALEGFVGAGEGRAVPMLCCMDNEEVGSRTRKGALSSFMVGTIERVAHALGEDDEGFRRAIARSFAVSSDNAHAVHPNHPELTDEGNRVWLNGGVVIKENAQQRYATDALSRAVFEEICRRAHVPTQHYANRSDIPCGSTIGNMLASSLGVPTVDIGAAQLAMHSAFETAGVCDTGHLMRAIAAFYETALLGEPNWPLRSA